MGNNYLKSIICKSAQVGLLAGVLMAGTILESSAQFNRSRMAKALAKVSQNAPVKNSTNLRVSAVLSLPQNSMTFMPDGNGGWIQTFNSTYAYDSDGRRVSKIDKTLATNQPMLKDSASYDIHGNLTESLYYTWNINSWDLLDGYRMLYTYTNGKITESIQQSWVNGVWENDYKDQTIYNAAGNPVEQMYSEWDNGAWTDYYKYIFTYPNPAGAPTEMLMMENVNGTWVSEAKYTNVVWHDFSKEQVQSYQEHSWNGASWDLEGRANLTYDPNGGYVELYEMHNNGSWINSDRWTESYDIQKNFIGFKGEEWVNNTWTLNWEEQEVLTYNTTNDVTERIFRDTYNASNLLEDSKKEVYSNFLRISGIKNTMPELQVAVYPNPVQNMLTIESAEAKAIQAHVVDMTGRLVLTEVLAPVSNVQFDLSKLNAGMYLLNLQTEAGTKTYRIIKQ